MEILTSSLFPEVKCSFSISHKIDLEIRKVLNEKMKSELRLTSREKEFRYFNLIVSTSTTTHKVEVKGPDLNQKEKIINWGIWLPYNEIVNSAHQEVPYLLFYFDALVLLFNNYGINENIIRTIQEEISNKVIGNSAYAYEEERIEYDFSEFDFK
ncbi:hypothetical protein [Planococcus salinarum]|uniref:hypothetical protein n=1 Tax=Planococcus salinarum TaxID=622695 RepID=UPI000E3C332E|nr:hypothetical protein [Planococcus salinarum]TAA71991.1 hypothetical protein D2909_08280 [Planococcus salinarum]